MSSDCPSSSDQPSDPSLDFLSPQFDPLRALQTSPSKLRLPYPAAQPCDNLQIYQSVVKGTRRVYGVGEGGGGTVGRGRGGGRGGEERKQRGTELDIRPGGRGKPKTVLWFMQSECLQLRFSPARFSLPHPFLLPPYPYKHTNTSTHIRTHFFIAALL